MTANHVNFTTSKLRTFKRVLATAEKQQRQTFEFEGDKYLTSYAKYLVEYLSTRLGA